ncbi:MAG: peptidoglycan DD-metalloendopeptidase family protein [Clostridia bacterium]|nr:peptidoglycan DD-metalloendopeptidase family protein [Clostridia bacterium]
MTKKILTLLLAAVLSLNLLSLISVAAPASSVEDARDKIQQSQDRREELEAQLEASKKEEQSYMAQKEIIEQQLGELNSEIDAYDDLISDLDSQISSMEKEISDAEVTYQDNIDKFKAQARATYEQGPISYLDVLLGAESFSDFLLRLDYVKQVALYERDLLDTITDSIQTIQNNKAQVEERRAEQVSARSAVESAKSSVDAKNDYLQSIVNKMNKDQAYLDKLIKAEQDNEEKLNQWIQDELSGRGESDVVYDTGDWLWPVERGNSYHYVSSGYGWRTLRGKRSFHYAIDIAVPKNTKVLASKSGEVIYSGWKNGGYGWLVQIDHGNGYITYYLHLNSKPPVSVGQHVQKGQVIGYVGMSGGTSTGYHLDIRFYVNGSPQNPLNYLKKPSWLTR